MFYLVKKHTKDDLCSAIMNKKLKLFFLAVSLCKKTFMMMVDGVYLYFCDDGDDDDEKC